MLSAHFIYCYPECSYTECHYAERRGTASGGGTVVEHMTTHPRIGSSSPTTTAGTGSEQMPPTLVKGEQAIEILGIKKNI